METGKNQSYNRTKNNLLVLNYLRNNGTASATILANALHLSNAALSSILKKLVERGQIKEISRHSLKGKGRKQVDYALNERSSLMALINIQYGKYFLDLADIKENVLVSEQFNVNQYDENTFENILNEIDRLIHLEEYQGIPLKMIIVSIPGKVNTIKKTIHCPLLNNPAYKGEDWLNIMKSRFPEAKIMTGSILSFAMQGEVHYGLAKEKEAAILVSNENIIWGSMAVEGKVFVGEEGYAGDFGAVPVMFEGKCAPLSTFASISALENHFGLNGFEELVKRFNEDEKAKQYILSTANMLGMLYSSIAGLLNISTIIMTGESVKLGEEYIETIRKPIESNEFKVNLVISNLNKGAIPLGAFYMGASSLIEQEAKAE